MGAEVPDLYRPPSLSRSVYDSPIPVSKRQPLKKYVTGKPLPTRITHRGLLRQDPLNYLIVTMEHFTNILCKGDLLCHAGEPNFLGSLALGTGCLIASGIILAIWVRIFDR